jgi:hypothetical protein
MNIFMEVATFLRKAKAVPLHAMEVLGGERRLQHSIRQIFLPHAFHVLRMENIYYVKKYGLICNLKDLPKY